MAPAELAGRPLGAPPLAGRGETIGTSMPLPKRHHLLLSAALLPMLLPLCEKPPRESSAPVVAVSIPPQKYFVKKIAGDRFSVLVMIPPGSSPHSYEPKPSQMTSLSKATLYFAIGIEFEKAWLGRIANACPRLAVIPTDSGIEKISAPGELDAGDIRKAAGADDHRHEGLDPHIWLSPELVKSQARAITEALCLRDAPHANMYRRNDSLFMIEIAALQAAIKATVSKRNGAPFMVFHPAWAYFAKEFGLREIAIEVQGKEPSPRELAGIATLARRSGITTIFVQPQFSRRSAEIIAREIGAKVAVADNLSEDWEANLMRFAKALAE